jgi:hypothetical protein
VIFHLPDMTLSLPECADLPAVNLFS